MIWSLQLSLLGSCALCCEGKPTWTREAAQLKSHQLVNGGVSSSSAVVPSLLFVKNSPLTLHRSLNASTGITLSDSPNRPADCATPRQPFDPSASRRQVGPAAQTIAASSLATGCRECLASLVSTGAVQDSPCRLHPRGRQVCSS